MTNQNFDAMNLDHKPEKKRTSVSEEDWKSKLSEEEFRVLRTKGTELPFSGEYNTHFEEGVYKCKACGTALFESDSKFRSNCGWPSFDAQISEEAVEKHRDLSHGMVRTEVLCNNCGGHLGHIFDDGPTETRVRYCINSVSLDFEENKTDKD